MLQQPFSFSSNNNFIFKFFPTYKKLLLIILIHLYHCTKNIFSFSFILQHAHSNNLSLTESRSCLLHSSVFQEFPFLFLIVVLMEWVTCRTPQETAKERFVSEKQMMLERIMKEWEEQEWEKSGHSASIFKRSSNLSFLRIGSVSTAFLGQDHGWIEFVA